MARPGRTWWGASFLEALEGFTDSARLQRGRAYSGDSRILAFAIEQDGVTATVRGNVNHYFGVHKEPRYQTRIQMTPIASKDWQKAIAVLGGRAGPVAKLLMHEMPDDIERIFADLKLSLLPRSRKDFKLTDCSCPDYANPCKHIAGVYYRLAEQLDQDPFLLFELRGMPRKRLHDALKRTPLGHALAALVSDQDQDQAPEPTATYFTPPVPAAAPPPDPDHFWTGARRLPGEIAPVTPAAVPAILIKKGGDFPAFWNRENSFLEVMEELYVRVRSKNQEI